MTTETEGQTQGLWKRLASMKCRNCYGDELLMQNGEGDSPCPDCQINGKPTGLLIPGLVRTCGDCGGRGVINGKRCGIEHRTHSALGINEGCSGTGFVSVDEDTALRVLLEHPNCSKVIQWSSPGSRKWEGYWCREPYDYAWVYSGGLSDSPLLALTAAVLAAQEES